MPKDRPLKEEPPAQARPAPYGLNWFPLWARLAAAGLLLAGLILHFTTPARRRASALSALTDAQVSVSEVSDGHSEEFGACFLHPDSRQPFLDVLGDCHQRPAWALETFRAALGQTAESGQLLACEMAWYLAQESAMQREDLEAVAKLLAGDRPAGVKRKAQRTLQDLCVLDVEAPAGTFAVHSARLKDDFWVDRTTQARFPFKAVSWSTPEQCREWWARFGARAVWDTRLKRFRIPAT